MPSESTSQGLEREPILVIDDDADQRTGLAEFLAAAGYQVAVACDGQEALDLLARGLHPTLIVLDLTMPRMDGWAFLERLRGTIHSTVPVLVTSAVAPEHPPWGADACVEKPVDPAAFSALVASLAAEEHAVRRPSSGAGGGAASAETPLGAAD